MRRSANQASQTARRRTISVASTSFRKKDGRLRADGWRRCRERLSRGAGDGRRRADQTTQWARRRTTALVVRRRRRLGPRIVLLLDGGDGDADALGVHAAIELDPPERRRVPAL